MKKTLLISLVFLLCKLTSAQSWNPLGKGVSGYKHYYYPPVGALATYKGKLYAGGVFDTAGGMYIPVIANWNGSSWDTLGGTIEGSDGQWVGTTIYTLATHDESLYLGGVIDNTGDDSIGTRGILSWNGTSYDSVAEGMYPGYLVIVSAFAEFNGNLIAGGMFDFAGELPANNIAQWNGTKWDSLGSGIILNSNDLVYCMASYNGNLYVGGQFTVAGGKHVSNIAVWNGTSWSPVNSGINGSVLALTVYNGKLYTGGVFDSAGGIAARGIAVWNDTVWSAVGKGIKASNGGVQAFTIFNGNIVVGGSFDTAGGIPANNLAQWNGTTWFSMGVRMNKGGYVAALTEYNGNLIVGGSFDSINGTYMNNIAQWCPGSCLPDTTVIANYNCKVYPNPSGGIFTIELGTLKDASDINIYNALGQKIYVGTLNPTTTALNLSSDAKGIYFYQIITQSGKLIGEGKIIKE